MKSRHAGGMVDTKRFVAYATRWRYNKMSTATVRIPEEKRDILKVIASVEKREMKDILAELIDEYIERHKETLDLLSRPGWVKAIQHGKKEVRREVKGKSRL